MPTLEEALTATLTAEAVEASFVQAVAGIQMTENAYVSPRDDVSHSTAEFVMPDTDAPGQTSRAETIAHAGALHTRTGDGRWVTLDLPRPALGPLAFLAILYGADLEQPVISDGTVIDVELSASLAIERVPDELRSTLDDLLSATDPAGDGTFPERSTARLRVREAPLHIAEATITTVLSGGSATTFALEIHPTSAITINIPDADASKTA